jgi:hypothetical protein
LLASLGKFAKQEPQPGNELVAKPANGGKMDSLQALAAKTAITQNSWCFRGIPLPIERKICYFDAKSKQFPAYFSQLLVVNVCCMP